MKNYLLLFILLFISCERKETRNNSDEDVKEAKQLTAKFYEELRVLDTLKIYQYLDKTVPKKDVGKLFVRNNNEYGNINNTEIKDISTTTVILNTNSDSKYRIEVVVLYDKMKCIETVSFTKKNNESAKLEGYLTQEVLN
jgi:hypothetical protein